MDVPREMGKRKKEERHGGRSRKREHTQGPCCSISGEDLNRVFVRFVVSTKWSVPGWGG